MIEAIQGIQRVRMLLELIVGAPNVDEIQPVQRVMLLQRQMISVIAVVGLAVDANHPSLPLIVEAALQFAHRF
jgi:hypothetical protein